MFNRKKRWNRRNPIPGLIMTAISFALGLAAVNYFAPLASTVMKGPQTLMLMLAIIFVIIRVMTFLHELGHLIAGALTRFELFRFAIGALTLENGPKGLRLRLARVPGAAGYVVMFPRDARDLTDRIMILTAGGPVASMLTGAVALLGFAVLREIPGLPWLTYSVGLFGFMSVNTALMNLVPLNLGSLTTDGSTIFQMALGGPKADYRAAMHVAQRWVSMGVPAEEWEAGIVRQMLVLKDGSPEDLLGLSIAVDFLVTKGKIEHAGRLVDRMARFYEDYKEGDGALWAIALDIAVFEGLYRGDPEAAQRWYDRAKQQQKKIPFKPPYHMAAGAVLLAQGEYKAAYATAQEGLVHLERLVPKMGPQSGTRHTLRLIMRRAEECYRQPATAD